MADPIAAGEFGPGLRSGRGQWARIMFTSGCVAGEGCKGTGKSTSSKFGRCSTEHSCKSGQTSIGDVFRRRGSIHGSTTLRVVGWDQLRSPGCSGCWRHGVSHNVEWSDFEKSRENGESGSPLHCRQHGAVRRVTLWGHARRPCGGGFSPRSSRFLTEDPRAPPVSQPQCRSSGWWRGRFRASDAFGEGPLPPTSSVLEVAAQPTEVEIQDSTILDLSSDGEPLVRPNNGTRIGDTVRDRSIYGRFSVLSEDTANSVHSGTRRLSLMYGGVPDTQLDEGSAREAPMDVFQFHLAQESDTSSLVTVPEDGFDDDLAEEDEIVSEEDWKSTVIKNRRWRSHSGCRSNGSSESLDGVNLVEEFDERACLMKTLLRFLKGPYRIALRTPLEEINVEDLGWQERGWKLFLVLPWLLLHRGRRGDTIDKQKLWGGRFEKFNSCAWMDLLEESQKVNQEAAEARRRRNRRIEDDLTCTWGRCRQPDKLSKELRSHSERTQGPAKRPPEPRTPLPRNLLNPVRTHSIQPGSKIAPPKYAISEKRCSRWATWDDG